MFVYVSGLKPSPERKYDEYLKHRVTGNIVITESTQPNTTHMY